MPRLLLKALCALILLAGPVAGQGFTLPELGLQSSGACRQLAVRDRTSNTMVPLACLDTTAHGWTFTPSAIQFQGTGSTGPVPNLTVPMPGRVIAPTLATALARTVSVEDWRRPEDGSDWGPGIQRAQQFLSTTGGMLRISTPGTLTIATQVSFPKGNPAIKLACDSQASILTNDPSLTKAMFQIGGSTAAGGMPFDTTGCTFNGANTTTSFAFNLNNANAMTIHNSLFTNMATAINATASYALTLENVTFNGVVSPFYSSTSAHNFVARRVKAYGGGTTIRLDGPTDNASIVESDFEGVGTSLQMAGGTSLRYVGNYCEYMVNDPIYSSAPLYGSDVSNNWIALGKANWSVVNWVGGQFKRNKIFSQTITFASSTIDLEVADNAVDGGSVAPMPYQAVTLQNNWVQQANYSVPGFRKASDGTVRLRGNLLNYTSSLGTAAFTLPNGYRPATQRVFMAAGTAGPTTVTINGDGNVYITATGGAGTNSNPYQAGLDGIAFEPGT